MCLFVYCEFMYRPLIPEAQPKPSVFLRDERFDGKPRPGRAAVFIHGIFSSHLTFEKVRKALANELRFGDWSLDAFDYDFWQAIPLSGRQLAEHLRAEFKEASEVTLVCHSMGGLVGRLALLQQGDALPFVKRLIMLGTPNYGTLHSARLALLAHLTRSGAGLLWSVSTRKTGIKELTEVDRMIKPYLTPEAIVRTQHVEYVTIPGLYFHEDTEWLRWGPPHTSLALKAVNLVMELSRAIPLAHVGLSQPHDGIVEENSVCLSPMVSSRFSERQDLAGDVDPRYLHILHPDYREVDHVTIQSADRTIEVLKELLPAKTANEWRLQVKARHELFRFTPDLPH